MSRATPYVIRPAPPYTRADYPTALANIRAMDPVAAHAATRTLALTDLYFLGVYVLGRPDADNDWVFDRCREVQAEPNGFLDLWSREHFKAVDVDEPVATPLGWRKHGDLVPGDQVFGPDGKPTRVVAKTPVFTDADCYRVTFCDGYSVVVSGDHLWTVNLPDKSRISGTNQRKKWKSATLNTRDLKGHVDAAIRTPSRRYPVVPVAAALQRPTRHLPLDPYVLGAWLGDGDARGSRVTAGLADAEEMAAILAATGVKVTTQRHSNCVSLKLGTGRRGDRTSSDVVNALRAIGVLGNKRIPTDYMMAAEHQRWALLQGLMDTDGSCAKSCGQAIFCNTNEALARDVFELAQSLGLKATIAERSGTYRGEPRSFWQVQFLGRSENAPFRLARKAAACSEIGKPGVRKVMSVEPVPSRPVSCIQVERDDGLYLIGRNLVTTHNSTIITNWLTIQDILNDPEITFGIFSHTRPIAKAFLRQIKQEFERNEWLKSLFPDVLYADPRKESPKWSEDEGIVVKRVGNPKEATVEAWGLVDGQPTSKHYGVLLYDDVVTRESVTTPTMIASVTSAWELSTNLGTDGGVRRFAGTHYHFADTYKAIIKKGSAKPRIYPCTVDGSVHGEPVLLSRETIQKKRADMGPFNFGAQMLLNPRADDVQGFNDDWLRYYGRVSGDRMIKTILIDPASAKKATSDYTAGLAVGFAEDENIYILDGVRDRLNLSQRWALLSGMHRTWKPRKVGYERYGKDADIEHFTSEMERDEYRFGITEVGGQMPKPDRIKRLIPYFEQGRIWIPNSLWKTDYEGKRYDWTQCFIEDEYKAFPVCIHDDILDALSRIFDLYPGGLPFPRARGEGGTSRAITEYDEWSGL